MTSRNAEIALIAQALEQHHPLTADEAGGIARTLIDAGGDAREVSLHWASTGGFPDTPDLFGYTPASMAGILRWPSQVLTTLVLMDTDPSLGLMLLDRAKETFPRLRREEEEQSR